MSAGWYCPATRGDCPGNLGCVGAVCRKLEPAPVAKQRTGDFSMTAALEELERTDPVVAKAAEDYRKGVNRILKETPAQAMNRMGAKVYKRLAYAGKFKPGECPDSKDGICYADDAPCVYGCDDASLPVEPVEGRDEAFNDVHTALTDRIAEIEAMSKAKGSGFRNHVTGLHAAIKIVREMK